MFYAVFPDVLTHWNKILHLLASTFLHVLKWNCILYLLYLSNQPLSGIPEHQVFIHFHYLVIFFVNPANISYYIENSHFGSRYTNSKMHFLCLWLLILTSEMSLTLLCGHKHLSSKLHCTWIWCIWPIKKEADPLNDSLNLMTLFLQAPIFIFLQNWFENQDERK